MPNRYVPRTRPPTAMDVLTKQGAAYPEPTVGEEGSISPEVLLESIQGNIDARTSQIQSRREGAGGLIKAGYVANKEGWLKPLGDKMWHTAGHAKMAISNKASNAYETGAKTVKAVAGSNFGLGAQTSATNILSKGQPASLGAKTASTFGAKAGAAMPYVLLATLAAKAIGSTKAGKQWNRSTNKWLKKKTGTGRTKNLLSPWKWRL